MNMCEFSVTIILLKNREISNKERGKINGERGKEREGEKEEKRKEEEN